MGMTATHGRRTNLAKFVLALWLAASPLAAQTPPEMTCFGSEPNWSATLSADGASFAYIGSSPMDVPQMSRAEGREWPLALTLISPDYRSTAILIVDARACDGGTHAAEVLTQRNETPVLLVGCCTLQD